MFVLLNAISNAASHSINLDDFLSESVYQIIYPFQSQLVSIFLVDEKSKGNPSENLYLASYFGLSSPGAMAMSNIVLPKSIFEDVIVKKQIMAIDDVQNESRVPDAIKEIEISNLVILPLLTQAGEDSRVLGAICLGRKDPNPYTQDELIRLTAIAEQIANLVDSDRRRQLAIALSEREKLMRDLHDSVSQKLYGLVAITEAAQAAIEAGTKVIPSEVLGRIGDNARQAVKEMRLFLYQMQPVDLEKGDLVFALHQRLGAVEGRASIQVRFLADEGIALSKDKEVALYYIAQEALNNTLKHARANSVTIRLRQTQKSVILEIVDNGEGFDMKNVKQGGMGLQNMKARVSQIDGRLTITSKPGSGTTVKVTVSRERRPKQIRKR
jgi:signal transduction histidine kinase